MTRPSAIYKLGGSTDETYPRLLASHPRNKHIDYMGLARYADHGDPSAPEEFDLFVKANRKFDAVRLAGVIGPMVSERLRAVLEGVVGDCLEFLPLAVNGNRFWIVRVVKVLDALDLSRSDIWYTVDGGFKEINVPVWLGDRIDDPMMFIIPQMRTRIWATPAVVNAYEQSECDGLHFGIRGTVV